MENFVQAVKATYATTGKSKTTNAFGMRPMQPTTF